MIPKRITAAQIRDAIKYKDPVLLQYDKDGSDRLVQILKYDKDRLLARQHFPIADKDLRTFEVGKIQRIVLFDDSVIRCARSIESLNSLELTHVRNELLSEIEVYGTGYFVAFVSGHPDYLFFFAGDEFNYACSIGLCGSEGADVDSKPEVRDGLKQQDVDLNAIEFCSARKWAKWRLKRVEELLSTRQSYKPLKSTPVRTSAAKPKPPRQGKRTRSSRSTVQLEPNSPASCGCLVVFCLVLIAMLISHLST